MSYQVLARKWRPRRFEEMVGQEHVVRALSNALDHDRVHHAFLFTGTRGVGKTSLARILAKALNCERGVSSKPCGACPACLDIDAGRFVDLIEVDAASRTGVDDTRDLLDNVQYAPARGQFKVYLIDEVHMFSKNSFNALLKTLEEPPPHVKFLLATTDPQKLPVTILSRCLQFNLRALAPGLIADHLAMILTQEGIAYERAAVSHIARAANGSVRDALSLLDQAISFGGGELGASHVADMLGSIDQRHVLDLLQALAVRDGPAVLNTVAQLDAMAPDYEQVLADLVTLLQRVALVQVAPEAVDDFVAEPEDLRRLAALLSPEDVQLFYQIGLIGRRDLPLSPECRGGMEMILLRMLAFIPEDGDATSVPGQRPSTRPRSRPNNPDAGLSTETAPDSTLDRAPAANEPSALPASPDVPARPRAAGRAGLAKQALNQAMSVDASPPPLPRSGDAGATRARAVELKQTAPVVTLPRRAAGLIKPSGQVRDDGAASVPAQTETDDVLPAPADEKRAPPDARAVDADRPLPMPMPGPDGLADADWDTLFQALPFKGVARELASHCVLTACDQNRVTLMVDTGQAHLRSQRTERGMQEVFAHLLGRSVAVQIETGDPGVRTPAARRAAREAERQKEAERIIESDPMIRELQTRFGATIVDGSIKPLD